ncbi:MAG: hypothetical protein Q9162_001123 [Coniocarpon cinnabarinum]
MSAQLLQRVGTLIFSYFSQTLSNPHKIAEFLATCFLTQLCTETLSHESEKIEFSSSASDSLTKADQPTHEDSTNVDTAHSTIAAAENAKEIVVQCLPPQPLFSRLAVNSDGGEADLRSEHLATPHDPSRAQDNTSQPCLDQRPSLPGELLLHIASFTTSSTALLNLALTCRLLTVPCLRARDVIPHSYRIFLPPRYIEQRRSICTFLDVGTDPYYHAIACGDHSWFFDVTIGLGVAREFKQKWEESCLRLLERAEEQEQGLGLKFEGWGWKRLARAKGFEESA